MTNATSGVDEVQLLERAAAAAADLIAGVGDDRWSAPTPCEEMGVHALVEHMIAGLEQFADVGAGRPLDITAQRDVPAERSSEEYREAARRMVATWSESGVVDRDYDMPWGATPGAALVDFMMIEQVAHGWDIATATGQTPTFAEDLAAAALERARRYDDETIRVPGMFGPELPAADDAPTIDRLAAFLGRRT